MTEHSLTLWHPISAKMITAKQRSGHSVFGPSGAEMWMSCEGSLIPNLLAEDNGNYEAAEGTAAHDMAERWLKTGERPDDMIGEIVYVGDYEIEITEEMLSYVEDYVDWCLADGGEFTQVEYRGLFDDLTPIPGQGGTADYVSASWQVLKIKDLKYGKDPVFAYYPDERKFNKQIAIYAYCVFRELDWLYNFQTIELGIGQPRLPNGFTTHTITRQELLDFAEEVREAATKAWVPDAPRTPSIKGCRWCKIKQKCPANYLFMANELDVFENWEEGDVIDLKPTSVSYAEMERANDIILDDMAVSPFPNIPAPPELSTAALAKLLRYRKMLEGFFNAVHAELLNRAISDEEDIPWWKVVQSRSLRRHTEDKEHIIEQFKNKGLSEDDLYDKTMKSPAAMERLLHSKAKMTLKAAAKWLEENGITVKPVGQKTLAATSDNRTALPKDGDVFINWDEMPEDEDDI